MISFSWGGSCFQHLHCKRAKRENRYQISHHFIGLILQYIFNSHLQRETLSNLNQVKMFFSVTSCLLCVGSDSFFGWVAYFFFDLHGLFHGLLWFRAA